MIQFGLNVSPNVGGLPMALRISAIADEHGLEVIDIQDHPYNPQLYDMKTPKLQRPTRPQLVSLLGAR